MPVFLAVSTKAAITTGALIGGAVAIIANNERLLEIAARALQRGAEVLNKRATERKHRVAYGPGMWNGEALERDGSGSDDEGDDSDVTTPSSTDVELSDMDHDKGSDGDSDGDSDDDITHDVSDHDDDIASVDIESISYEKSTARRRTNANELIVDEVD